MRACVGLVGGVHKGGGGVCALHFLKRPAVAPPFGQHAQYTDHHAQSENAKHHEHQRTRPLCAKKEMQGDVARIVQRKGKQRKEDGRFERPL